MSSIVPTWQKKIPFRPLSKRSRARKVPTDSMLTIKEASLVTFLVLFAVIALVLLQGGTDMESETLTDPMQEILVGAWEERDPNDDEIQQMLPNIFKRVNEQTNDDYHLMLIRVLKVSSQVVAGVRYKVEVQVAPSDCKKSSGEQFDLKTCKRLEGQPEKIMKLDIWDKPWENFFQVSIVETKLLP